MSDLTCIHADMASQISVPCCRRTLWRGVRRRWKSGCAISVDRARARGLNVGFDMHTRGYGITNLSAVLPPYIVEGGTAALEKRLRDLGRSRPRSRFECRI